VSSLPGWRHPPGQGGHNKRNRKRTRINASLWNPIKPRKLIDSNTRLYPNTQLGNQQKHKKSSKEENTLNKIPPPTGGNPAIRTSHMHLGHSYEIFRVLCTDSIKKLCSILLNSLAMHMGSLMQMKNDTAKK